MPTSKFKVKSTTGVQLKRVKARKIRNRAVQIKEDRLLFDKIDSQFTEILESKNPPVPKIESLHNLFTELSTLELTPEHYPAVINKFWSIESEIAQGGLDAGTDAKRKDFSKVLNELFLKIGEMGMFADNWPLLESLAHIQAELTKKMERRDKVTTAEEFARLAEGYLERSIPCTKVSEKMEELAEYFAEVNLKALFYPINICKVFPPAKHEITTEPFSAQKLALTTGVFLSSLAPFANYTTNKAINFNEENNGFGLQGWISLIVSSGTVVSLLGIGVWGLLKKYSRKNQENSADIESTAPANESNDHGNLATSTYIELAKDSVSSSSSSNSDDNDHRNEESLLALYNICHGEFSWKRHKYLQSTQNNQGIDPASALEEISCIMAHCIHNTFKRLQCKGFKLTYETVKKFASSYLKDEEVDAAFTKVWEASCKALGLKANEKIPFYENTQPFSENVSRPKPYDVPRQLLPNGFFPPANYDNPRAHSHDEQRSLLSGLVGY